MMDFTTNTFFFETASQSSGKQKLIVVYDIHMQTVINIFKKTDFAKWKHKNRLFGVMFIY